MALPRDYWIKCRGHIAGVPVREEAKRKLGGDKND